MANATGVAKEPPLRVAFDRRLKLEFHGASITSDSALLAYRELDDALDLTMMGVSALAEGRRGRNTGTSRRVEGPPTPSPTRRGVAGPKRIAGVKYLTGRAAAPGRHCLGEPHQPKGHPPGCESSVGRSDP